jgi:hypothetical protein
VTFDPLPPTPVEPPRRVQERGRFGAGAAIGTLLGIVVTAAFVLGAVWMLGHQQRIIDQFVVWEFEPDPVIAGYADRADLTDEGRFLFYASQPEVAAGEAFDSICSAGDEGFGVLGCYLPSERRIYLYDVTDDRLDGLEEVVATHEMLHAVWDRMSDDERDALGPLLEAEAEKLAENAEFAATMEFYAQTEPGQRLNELHSILGTEVGGLSPALEAHYARFVGNRETVVALHDQSSAVFLEQQARAEALVAQIEALVTGMEADYAVYSAGYSTLNADIDVFNARADSGDFTSQAQFDAERDAILARQSELDGFYATITERDAQYDQLVLDLEAINAEIDGLNASINIDPPDLPDLSGQ